MALVPALWGEGLPSALAHRDEVASAGSAGERVLTVPAQTLADIVLLSGMHTRFNSVDDPVRAQLLRPIVIDGQVALPPGTVLGGRVIRVHPAGRLRRPGELGFRFDRMVLPDGQIEPLRAMLISIDDPTHRMRVDSEGYLKGTGFAPWKSITIGVLAAGAFTGAKLASAGAAGTILPVAGGAFLGYELLWHRGTEVSVPPQTRARIRLDDPVTVQVNW
jgi:hypothetical protein